MSESRAQRRHPRYEAAIACTLALREGPLELITADVSRHGVFLRTERPRPAFELIPIRFRTPVGELEAVCNVVRSYPPSAPSDRGPGMSLCFVAIAQEAKERWEAFVDDLELRRGAALLSPPAGVRPPRHAKASERQKVHEGELDERRAPQKACFLVRFRNKARLREFLSTDVSQGGMFLRTPVPRGIGDPVDMVLVHPESQQEFPLSGRVVRVVAHEDPTRRGLGVRFDPLTGERLTHLVAFIETGASAESTRESTREHELGELLRLAAEDPRSADAPLALGVTLLEGGDGHAALEALTKALVLAPDRVEVHRALEVAYRVLQDDERARAHARVADALEARR